MTATCGLLTIPGDDNTTCGAPAVTHFLIPPSVHGEWSAYLTCEAHQDAARTLSVDEHPAGNPCPSDRSRWVFRQPRGESFCRDPEETRAIHEAMSIPARVLEDAR